MTATRIGKLQDGNMADFLPGLEWIIRHCLLKTPDMHSLALQIASCWKPKASVVLFQSHHCDLTRFQTDSISDIK